MKRKTWDAMREVGVGLEGGTGQRVVGGRHGAAGVYPVCGGDLGDGAFGAGAGAFGAGWCAGAGADGDGDGGKGTPGP